MKKETNLDFIKKSGQEMYFDEETAGKMIERENNEEHILVSKIFEAILVTEFKNRENLKIADLGAGAHPKRYIRFLDFLKRSNGSLFWVDQSPYMLSCASKKTPPEFKDMINFKEEEMTGFLREKEGNLDGIILKYSFNYCIPETLENWMGIMHKSLKKNGKVVANLHLYEKGMRERSYNAIYKIEGKKIESGYGPKDNEVIGISFLKKPGDESPEPETFASTKIIYYTPEQIEKTAKEAGFSSVKIFRNWEKNEVWLKAFKEFSPDLWSKSKPFLILEK